MRVFWSFLLGALVVACNLGVSETEESVPGSIGGVGFPRPTEVPPGTGGGFFGTGGVSGTGGLAADAAAGGDPCAARDCVFQPSPSASPTPSAAPDAGPLVCDVAPAPVTRTECPASEPGVTDCTRDELRCLYAVADAGTCFSVWLCRLGLWSPAGIACEEPPSPEDSELENDPACPEGLPVDDSACSMEGLECGYHACWNGPPAVIARCVCGRFQTESVGCTTVP